MKTKEINELTLKELNERIDSEKANLVHLKMNHAVSPLNNPSKIMQTRRLIARMLTNLKQRENANK